MAHTVLRWCDYEGCTALLDDTGAHLQLYVGAESIPEELAGEMDLALDLCEEHVDLVLGRILRSPSLNP